jgi:serine protease 12 (motopsin)
VCTPKGISGRLSIYKDGWWGTVCDDLANKKLARVVCRQMGLPYNNASVNTNITFGKGPIHLDNVKCKGTEKSIMDCERSNKPHNCDHSEDLGINCESTNGCTGNQFLRDNKRGKYCVEKKEGCIL